MIRAFFLAVGIFLIILGLEALVVSQVTLRWAEPKADQQSASTYMVSTREPQPAKVEPPEWAPWVFLASGTITILYAFALPKKLAAAAAGG